jgi:hypothetical protein
MSYLAPILPLSQAGPNDVDNLVDVYLASMQDHITWDYVYPFRKKYPEEHRYGASVVFRHLLSEEQDDFIVMIVEHRAHEHPHANRIISFAVWDVAYVNRRKHGPDYAVKARKFSPATAAVFRTAR